MQSSNSIAFCWVSLTGVIWQVFLMQSYFTIKSGGLTAKHIAQLGPVLLTLLWHVARILANGSAAFFESCDVIGWNSCDVSQKTLVIQGPDVVKSFAFETEISSKPSPIVFIAVLICVVRFNTHPMSFWITQLPRLYKPRLSFSPPEELVSEEPVCLTTYCKTVLQVDQYLWIYPVNHVFA